MLSPHRDGHARAGKLLDRAEIGSQFARLPDQTSGALTDRNMKPIRLSGLIAALIAALSICPSARAQNVPEGTTLGRSQNSTEDLVNSLVPGPKRFDRGEKKEEVDPKKLPSKKLNDKTSSGNLMDIV